MSKNSLTDAKVRALLPKDEAYRIKDTEVRGLGLTVYTSGKKSWSWKGRTASGVMTYTLGSFPAYDVRAAREFASAIILDKERGTDPLLASSDTAFSPAVATARSLDWAFEKYMEQEGSQRKSAGEKWRIYKKEIQPKLGEKSIYKLRFEDFAEIVANKYDSAPVMSNNMVALIKRFGRWCTTKGRVYTKLEVDFSSSLVKITAPRQRERYLDDYELSIIRPLLQSSSSRLSEPTRVILLTGVRRAEAFEARWSEFDFSKGVWTIPSQRSKNGDELVLPLSRQALSILSRRRRFAGNYDLVWPGRNGPDKPMSGYSKAIGDLNVAMSKVAARDRRTVTPWSLHDLRRSVATGMTGLLDENFRPLIPTEVVERILNHKQVGIRRIYNRWDYFAEKKHALQLWADHLDSLIPDVR